MSEIFAQKTLNADYSKAFSLTTLCHNVIDYSYFSSCKTTPNFVCRKYFNSKVIRF